MRKFNKPVIGGICFVLLQICATTVSMAASNYLEVGHASIFSHYANTTARFNAVTIRGGRYVTSSVYGEFEMSFGMGEDDLYHFDARSNEVVLGRLSTFDNMQLDISLRTMSGLYVGGMHQMSRRMDLVGKFGLVYLSYEQNLAARNATLGDLAFQTNYKEDIGGSVFGFAIGVGANYYVNRLTSVTFEVIRLPTADDAIQWRAADNSLHEGYSEIRSSVVHIGARMHF